MDGSYVWMLTVLQVAAVDVFRPMCDVSLLRYHQSWADLCQTEASIVQVSHDLQASSTANVHYTIATQTPCLA
eukprot:207755-Amphidinium_carterae.1